jgi:apolipoprotein N-acyltransferase
MRIIRFIAATIAFTILAMLFVAYGNNTGYNGHFDLDTYWNSFLSAFGGLGSFMALVVVVILLFAAYVAILRLAEVNRNRVAAGLGTTLIIIALLVGAIWVHIDWNYFGGLGPFVVFLLIAALCTAIIGAILGIVSVPIRRRTTTTNTTP